MRHSALAYALCLGLVASVGGCLRGLVPHQARGPRSASHAWETPGPLEINSKNGSIRLEMAPELTSIEVEADFSCGGMNEEEARMRLERVELSARLGDDGVVRIEPFFPEPTVSGDGADLRVRLPGAAGVAVRTTNGSIAVVGIDEALSGELDLRTSNGGISVENHTGLVKAESSNGPITVSEIDGDLRAVTSNGGITAKSIAGRVDATTSNAGISLRLDEGQGGPITAATSNARIELVATASLKGRLEVHTSNAGIRIEDPHGLVTDKALRKSSGHLILGGETEELPVSKLETANAPIVVRLQ